MFYIGIVADSGNNVLQKKDYKKISKKNIILVQYCLDLLTDKLHYELVTHLFCVLCRFQFLSIFLNVMELFSNRLNCVQIIAINIMYSDKEIYT